MWARPTEQEVTDLMPTGGSMQRALESAALGNLFPDHEATDLCVSTHTIQVKECFGSSRYRPYGLYDGVDAILDTHTGKLWSRKPVTSSNQVENQYMPPEHKRHGSWLLPTLNEFECLMKVEDVSQADHLTRLRRYFVNPTGEFLLDNDVVFDVESLLYGSDPTSKRVKGKPYEALMVFSKNQNPTVDDIVDPMHPDRFKMVGLFDGRQSVLDQYTGYIWTMESEVFEANGECEEVQEPPQSTDELRQQYMDALTEFVDAKKKRKDAKKALLKALKNRGKD